jgi:hypothetical protein
MITVRPESAQNKEMILMLENTASHMLTKLHCNGIDFDDDAVKIWIKEFATGKLYPKIEIDYNHQEIQYDMTEDGLIREVHFKLFKLSGWDRQRIDIDKEQADPILIRADNIIRYNAKTP